MTSFILLAIAAISPATFAAILWGSLLLVTIVFVFIAWTLYDGRHSVTS